jgi:hypothetical protein
LMKLRLGQPQFRHMDCFLEGRVTVPELGGVR